jgi:GTP-binding protein
MIILQKTIKEHFYSSDMKYKKINNLLDTSPELVEFNEVVEMEKYYLEKASFITQLTKAFYIKEIDGIKQEPIERVHIEVPEEYSGGVIEELSRRRGEMTALSTNEHGVAKLEFSLPTRGLMGYRGRFLTFTRGLGILTSIFDHFSAMKGPIAGRTRGVMISSNDGKTNGYGCFNLQERGTLFVAPGEPVYEGMSVGEHSRDNDLLVNVTKAKQLTNVRASGSDENIILIPPRQFTLEQAIDYIEDDEQIEVTPRSIRMRKRYLKEHERKKNTSK